MRAIGLDVHLEFCEVAIAEKGEVRSTGRIATKPGVTGFQVFVDGAPKGLFIPSGNVLERFRQCRATRREDTFQVRVVELPKCSRVLEQLADDPAA